MDYGRMGAAKIGTNKPRHADQDGRGAPKGRGADADKKAELLKRMKAAAQRSQGQDGDKPSS